MPVSSGLSRTYHALVYYGVMLLLSFTVRNHKSIRDEITLDLVRPDQQVLAAGEDWPQMVYPIAGIFGGNATGKSTVLNALGYVFSAINNSATLWQLEKQLPWEPFYLNEHWATSTSVYELEFIYDDATYTYGFEVGAEQIHNEWLRIDGKANQQLAFTREELVKTNEQRLEQPIIGGLSARELILSRALRVTDSPLHGLATHLINHFDWITTRPDEREGRLSEIEEAVADGTYSKEQILSLLQVADIGVTDIGLVEDVYPADERIQLAIKQFNAALNEGHDPKRPPVTIGYGRPGDDQSKHIVRQLVFKHKHSSSHVPSFPLSHESDGTIAWLILATAALDTLNAGGLLLVDEIDASLHPHLVDALLTIFTDPSINQHKAQLIFTTHDTYVLSPLSEVDLDPEQVWLTNKSNEGVTTLTCLADFPYKPNTDVAKRYLIGRYGGLPYLVPSQFASAMGTSSR